MEPQPRAVIDVGTNSVKLLVARVGGRSVEPLFEQSEQTRLGRGFYETQRLQPDAVAATARAVAEFAAMARQRRADPIRVIATSAARDARNPAELVDAIRRSSGLTLDIISGEQEADYVFQGVASDPRLAALSVLILDVGGGSTEFIVGEAGRATFRRSFPLGTVRLLETLPPNDPPRADDWEHCRAWLQDFLDRQISPAVAPVLRARGQPLQVVGTGGTTTLLARMHHETNDFDRDLIEATRFGREQIRARREHLWSLPLAERKRIAGLPPNRADVILFGVAIYEAILEKFSFTELRVSTRGLRFGAVLAPP